MEREPVETQGLLDGEADHIQVSWCAPQTTAYNDQQPTIKL